jgi:glyoxylase-like metal-dependent hydrolase (beta-lactamase superfamily II)
MDVPRIMIEEIVPNLYRTEIPLPKSPLKWLNSYIVKGDDKFLIIDTGFNCEECQNELNASLQQLDVNLNKTDIFVTHLHVDHIGLAGALATDNSKVYLNEKEIQQINIQQSNWESYWQKVLDIYVANGFPIEDASLSMKNHPARKYGLKRAVPFSPVKDGDIIKIGDFHFQCVATPGHSPGHMCLYEPNKKILVAGDHILFDITPNITYWSEMDDSLNEYLKSLEKVRALDVKIILPGHRRLMHSLHSRIMELQKHHGDRLNEVLTALKDGDKTPLQIASCITWDIACKSWEEFPPAQKWFAFGETLAHLKFLENKNKIRSHGQNGKVSYSLA